MPFVRDGPSPQFQPNHSSDHKAKKQTRECWADFAGAIRTQIADVTSRYRQVFLRKKLEKLENEVP